MFTFSLHAFGSCVLLLFGLWSTPQRDSNFVFKLKFCLFKAPRLQSKPYFQQNLIQIFVWSNFPATNKMGWICSIVLVHIFYLNRFNPTLNMFASMIFCSMGKISFSILFSLSFVEGKSSRYFWGSICAAFIIRL